MQRFFVISFFLILFSSCDRTLTRAKHYVGTPKDILQLHLGEAHMIIDNGENGEILVYFFNQLDLEIGHNINTDPQYAASDQILIHNPITWNCVVFLVDMEDVVYHTSKKFYRVSPFKFKRMLLDEFG
jgi:hypothetical protein